MRHTAKFILDGSELMTEIVNGPKTTEDLKKKFHLNF
jgi:hypothetical protein